MNKQTVIRLAALMVTLGGVSAARADAKLSFDAPTVTGALDAKAAGKVVTAKKTALARCFATEEANMQSDTGSATLKISVGSDGKVTEVSASRLILGISSCIEDEVKKLQFARPTDGKPAEVAIPLRFTKTGAYGWFLTSQPDPSPPKLDFTVGHGSGTGAGYRVKPTGVPTIRLGQPTVKGELETAFIRRHLKANIEELRSCYVKELVATKDLQGTVTIAFTIGADGRVSHSTGSGLGNSNVETCTAGVIKALTFPKPKRGDVIVSYPFTFHPGTPATPATPTKPAAATPATPKP